MRASAARWSGWRDGAQENDHEKDGFALLVGDAVADDVGVRLGAEAADHEDGDARELKPAGQLLSRRRRQPQGPHGGCRRSLR